MYSLKAVLDHLGRKTTSGHYIVKIKVNGCWFCFNDRKVSKSQQCGYLSIFFFKWMIYQQNIFFILKFPLVHLHLCRQMYTFLSTNDVVRNKPCLENFNAAMLFLKFYCKRS